MSDRADSSAFQAAAERLRHNPHDHDALETLGAWHLARAEPEKALEYLHRISREDPGRPGVWRLKAEAFEALGDDANAARCRAREADGSP